MSRSRRGALGTCVSVHAGEAVGAHVRLALVPLPPYECFLTDPHLLGDIGPAQAKLTPPPTEPPRRESVARDRQGVSRRGAQAHGNGHSPGCDATMNPFGGEKLKSCGGYQLHSN